MPLGVRVGTQGSLVVTTRFARVAAFSCVVLGCTLLWSWTPLGAQTEEKPQKRRFGSFRQAFSRKKKAARPEVKLSYFGATWERVLKDVAKQMDRELVADRVPGGRITRRDRTAHSIPEAIRILNTELEKKNFRLLLQEKHLVLLNLDSARSRYARPVPKVDEPSSPADFQFDPVSNQLTKLNLNKPTTPANLGVSAFEPTPTVKPRPVQLAVAQEKPRKGTRVHTIRRASARQELNEVPKLTVEEPAIPTGPMIERTMKVVNRKASDVARSVYDVFSVGAKANLNRQGVGGLPSFTVYHRGANADKPHFEVGIDRTRNALVLSAPQRSLDQLVRLIRDLDGVSGEGQPDVKVVPTQHVTAKSTKELQQEINRLTSRYQRTAFKPETSFFAQQENENPQQPGDGPMNLQGDVILQPPEELGAIIVKGNQADLETVERIIKQLEELSEGTLPGIKMVELKSVNSEALAELLTTVYDRLTELRERSETERKNNIGFVPVVKPNAILVLAPEVEMQAIRDLIEKLDKRVNPTYEFEVFHLKNAIASQVVTALEQFYTEPTGLATRVRAIADVRTNSVVVQARPSDLEEVAALVEKIDRDEAGKVSRIKLIRLRNAQAEELSETINTAIQEIINPPQGNNAGFGAGGASSTALRDSQSVVLEFLTKQGDIERLIRSGILVDVRVREDVRTNSLIVTAPDQSMQLMEALIKQLDSPPASVADIKVFTLERADATQAVELLQGLFEDQNAEGEVGVAIAGAEDASSSLIPLRFSADVRTNTVLAAGSAESLTIVEAILLRLDEADTRNRDTRVIQLRNAPAGDVATALSNFLTQQQQLLDSTADLRSNIERLESEVVVEPETNTNSLIISATPTQFEKIEAVIKRLDANQPQVVIQALIVEVELDNTDEFGVEMGFQDPLLFGRSLVENLQTITNVTTLPNGNLIQEQVIISQEGNPGFLFNNTNALGNNNTGGASQLGTQGLSNFSLGRQNTDLGFGGFVFSASSNSVNVLVRALAAKRTLHVLSRPQIRTLHNQPGLIQVGQEVPVVTGASTTALGALQPTVDRQPAGIILEVLPTISPDGTIVMDVQAEKSAFDGQGVPLFVDSTTGNTVTSPLKSITLADSKISVPNGQTVVMGGMITKQEETLERKVPWLGDIPVLGSAFRYDGTTTRRTELLIFLTPRVISTDADSEIIKQIEADRIHWIESDGEEIHGPIFSTPVPDAGDRRSGQAIEVPQMQLQSN